MRRILLLAITGLLSAVLPVAAQTAAAVPKGDVLAAIGWLNVDKDGVDGYNDWYRSVYGSVGAGWLVADHVRLEVDGGASTDADLYRVRQVPRAGGVAYISSRSVFSTRRVGAGLLYQFFENAWFHPHVGVGMDLTWERVREDVDPVFFYDELTRQTRTVQPGETVGPLTTRQARPFVSAGFKAYVTERAFVRSDARALVKGGVDEVVWRFGVGVDF